MVPGSGVVSNIKKFGQEEREMEMISIRSLVSPSFWCNFSFSRSIPGWGFSRNMRRRFNVVVEPRTVRRQIIIERE